MWIIRKIHDDHYVFGRKTDHRLAGSIDRIADHPDGWWRVRFNNLRSINYSGNYDRCIGYVRGVEAAVQVREERS